jgi:hypothetical protein
MIDEIKQLTILTDPVPVGIHYFKENFKQVARGFKSKFYPQPQFMRSKYRGHFAVTRSIVEGLNKIDYSYNYNPKKLADIANVVIVLSGVSALRQAISLKRKGMIKKLLAGPNLVTFPSDHDGIICSPEVDICVTPGPLTCDIYREDCPDLEGRCVGWPAGVDTEFWSPQQNLRKKSILIYDKPTQGFTDAVGKYIDWVTQKGYEPLVMEYGRYTKGEYLNALQKASFMIGFTAAESQGISWAEAWSADVPTLIWYKGQHSFIHPRLGERTYKTSTAPYLSDSTGAFFRSFDHFTELFSAWEAGELKFSPRQWTQNNMSDESCANRLLEIAGLVTRRHVE